MNYSSSKRRTGKIVAFCIAALISVFFLAPFYFTAVNAVRAVMAPPTLTLPKPAYLGNFIESITRIPFWRSLKSSGIILLFALGLGIVINYILGFAFATLQAPLKEFWFAVIISLMMIPEVASTIPQYIIFTKMRLNNTYWIWLLVALGGTPYYVFLFRQFMQNIPIELSEAARIDGCSTLGIMTKIYVPNTKPVIAVVFMFMFLANWGDVNMPFLYLDMSKWPLANALQGHYYTMPNNATIVYVPLQLAFSLLFMIPSVLVYFFGQKHLQEGMIASGIK